MIKLNPTLRNARAQLVLTAIDNASTPGSVQFYAGNMPTPVGAAITNQVLIATCPLSKPCGLVSSDGSVTFNAITDDLAADQSGTIGFGRVVDGDGVFVFDADAGLAGVDANNDPLSTAFFKFASLVAIAGGTVKINSMGFGAGNN